jgi:integrase
MSEISKTKIPPTGGSHLTHAHPSSFEMRRTEPVPTRGVRDGFRAFWRCRVKARCIGRCAGLNHVVPSQADASRGNEGASSRTQSRLILDCARKAYNLVTRRRQLTFYPDEIEIQEAHSKHRNLTVKRRYLTEREIERLMDYARKYGRYGHRDATMILVAYRHGLRASEVCDLQWQQIELSEGRLHVHRVKNGIPSVHPIRGDEMRALRKLRREYPKDAYVFVSERGGPIGPIGFHRLIQRVGEAAKMPFPIHPHMLRHACGFKLANDGHDTRALQHYLGHKNIQHTVRYTDMAPDRFKDFWRGY